ncbi:MAG TPA: hypothetical protein VHC22_01285 [Pirellulales bacterium]|nr:hypothetical protein [Pirellulales bacterium]
MKTYDDHSLCASPTPVDLEPAARQVVCEANSLNGALRFVDELHESARPELSLIVDAALLHARRLTDFLLREPGNNDLGAHHFLEGDGWRYVPTGCPYLLSQHANLESAAGRLERDPGDTEVSHWNLAALSNELANKWDNFLAVLPAERLTWFLTRGTHQFLRLYRVRGKLQYGGSPPRLSRR